MESAFSLSDAAAAQINHLKQKEGETALRFRVTVKGGGCSGFQYEFALDDNAPGPQDAVFQNHGAEVVVDDISLGVIKGAMLDYTEDLAQAGFSIKNPNATAKCGCGNSFSV
jgi:iron-sulfur cluster insertion protein